MTWLQAIHMVAALVVLAEGLNKLERTDLFGGREGVQKARALGWLLVPWRWRRARVVLVLKAFGWSALCVGACGALVAPLIHLDMPSVPDAAVMAGFALLVVRSRMREGTAGWIDPRVKLPEVVYEADGSVNCVLVHFRMPIEAGSQFQTCNTVYLRDNQHPFDGWMPLPPKPQPKE